MSRQLLRHTVATVAYRGGKTLRDVSDEFGGYKSSPTSPSPAEIVAHICDLFDWALSMAKGQQKWNNSAALPWAEGAARFHAALGAFDDYLASDAPLEYPAERLFQGPVADALTHVGQLAMLRRLAGFPMKGENYAVGDIATGRTGADQAAPRREFA